MSKTILTGLKSNSGLTIGNYLGAIKPMIERQVEMEEGDKFFLFVPDLHSFTIEIDWQNFYQQTLDNVKTYLASGVDPAKSGTFIYRQSAIPAHSELAWILSCFTYYGESQRMTQFKDKSTNKGENVSVGLFTYPILMAADILLYNAEYVPLGIDQRQHLELTRDVAIRFNNKFQNITGEEVFKVPKKWQDQLDFMNLKEGVKIRSLSKPESKMSKSVSDPKGTIMMSDDPKQAAKKIMSATTDNLGKINWDWENQPGITNLLQLLALLSKKTFEEIKTEWEGGEKYGDLKKAVAQKVEEFLTDFQTKFNQVTNEEVEKILKSHEEKASIIANQTLLKAQKAVGVKK